MSKQRVMKQEPLVKGPNGFYLCRWCKKEVLPPRSTFCNQKCVHEYMLRTDPSYVRTCLQERDKGICAHCGLDTLKLHREMKELLVSRDPRDQSRFLVFLDEWKVDMAFQSLWDADHILEVAEGGGLSDLSNYQTLCKKCHRKKTAEFNKKRRAK